MAVNIQYWLEIGPTTVQWIGILWRSEQMSETESKSTNRTCKRPVAPTQEAAEILVVTVENSWKKVQHDIRYVLLSFEPYCYSDNTWKWNWSLQKQIKLRYTGLCTWRGDEIACAMEPVDVRAGFGRSLHRMHTKWGCKGTMNHLCPNTYYCFCVLDPNYGLLTVDSSVLEWTFVGCHCYLARPLPCQITVDTDNS